MTALGTRTGTAMRRWLRNSALWAHVGVLAGGCGKPPCEETLTCPRPGASAGHAGKGGTTAGETAMEPHSGAGGRSPVTSVGGASGDADKDDTNVAGEAATPAHSGAGEGGSPPSDDSEMAGEDGTAAPAGAAGASYEGPEPRCNISKPFQPATYVASLSAVAYMDASLTADGLEMILWLGDELATATRTTLDDPFGPAAPDPLMGKAATWFLQGQQVFLPKISADRLTLYSGYGGENRYTTWAATRSSPSQPFGDPQEVADLRDVNRIAPFPAFDDRALYFREDHHLHFALKRPDGGFDASTPLTSLNSPEGEDHPIPRHDELAIYFSTTRTDGKAKGENDIWVARRQSTSDEFDAPQAVEELNTSSSEIPAWVSADECELFFIRYVYVSAEASWTPRVMSARRPK